MIISNRRAGSYVVGVLVTATLTGAAAADSIVDFGSDAGKLGSPGTVFFQADFGNVAGNWIYSADAVEVRSTNGVGAFEQALPFLVFASKDLSGIDGTLGLEADVELLADNNSTYNLFTLQLISEVGSVESKSEYAFDVTPIQGILDPANNTGTAAAAGSYTLTFASGLANPTTVMNGGANLANITKLLFLVQSSFNSGPNQVISIGIDEVRTVPEPGSAAMLLAGPATLLLKRRKS